MNRTVRLSFVTGASDLLAMTTEQKFGSMASCAPRPQFRDTNQVEGRATEHEQPIHLRQTAQFP